MVPLSFGDALLGVLLVVANLTDLRTQKIKNWLTFPVAAGGLVWASATPPWHDGVLGFGAAAATAIPGWRFGGAIRAGDVKMLIAAGTILGPEAAIRAVLFTYALGIPYGLVVLALRGRLTRLVSFYQQRGAGMEPTVVAYAPVVSAGVLIARFTGWIDLW